MPAAAEPRRRAGELHPGNQARRIGGGKQLRQIGEAVGLDTHQQTRFTTALSEIARNAVQYAGLQPLSDPAISPAHADLRGLPPLLIQAAASEILVDDSRRLADNARQAGVDTELQIWNGVWHVWQAMPVLVPEADAALASAAAFLRRAWHL